MQYPSRRGFTLLEVIVVVAIITILSSIALFSMSEARIKARDAERKSEVAQYGRILTASCFTPGAGPGEYDLADVIVEFAAQNTQYAEYLALIPQDPSGSASETRYRYVVDGDGKCALFANLENSKERVTLQITTATPSGGSGVFQAPASGWNGTDKYFHVSN
jgi:prepilin-type N-terminal cleavage/methylation domain-containing protein